MADDDGGPLLVKRKTKNNTFCVCEAAWLSRDLACAWPETGATYATMFNQHFATPCGCPTRDREDRTAGALKSKRKCLQLAAGVQVEKTSWRSLAGSAGGIQWPRPRYSPSTPNLNLHLPNMGPPLPQPSDPNLSAHQLAHQLSAVAYQAAAAAAAAAAAVREAAVREAAVREAAVRAAAVEAAAAEAAAAAAAAAAAPATAGTATALAETETAETARATACTTLVAELAARQLDLTDRETGLTGRETGLTEREAAVTARETDVAAREAAMQPALVERPESQTALVTTRAGREMALVTASPEQQEAHRAKETPEQQEAHRAKENATRATTSMVMQLHRQDPLTRTLYCSLLPEGATPEGATPEGATPNGATPNGATRGSRHKSATAASTPTAPLQLIPASLEYLANALRSPRDSKRMATLPATPDMGGGAALKAGGYRDYGASQAHLDAAAQHLTNGQADAAQEANTLVLDDPPPQGGPTSSRADLLALPAIRRLADAVETVLVKALGKNALLDIVLTHGHLLDQTAPAARFGPHTDQEENLPYGESELRRSRHVAVTAVILLRRGNLHASGLSGVKVSGAGSAAYFTNAGDCHIFASELWHESVCTYPEAAAAVRAGIKQGNHGDLKLTLFWGVLGNLASDHH